ncbi:MAG: response regulator [Spirochaetales bacterium]|nr:response regulator [Spirochaetales bacterium]
MELLVIDDSPSFRHVVLQTLLEAGYNAVGAASPEEGLQLLGQRKFALVLCDWNMPGLGGLDLIKQVKGADGPNRFTPILIVTTERDETRKAQARSAGASAWLVKPFEMTTLVGAVQKLLG